jgi:hypothetical protein
MPAPRYAFRAMQPNEAGYLRDAFARNVARTMLGKVLDLDQRHPETPVCSPRERAQMLALAEYVQTTSDVAVLATPAGSVAGFLLTTPQRPVWRYVAYTFRDIGEQGYRAEDVILARVKDLWPESKGFVFQR